MFWFYATSFVLWVAIFAIVNLRVFFWIGTHTLNVEYRSVKWWKHTPQLKWAQTHFLEYKWEIVLHFFFFHQTSYAQYKAAPLKVKTLISGPETAWDNILTLIIKNAEMKNEDIHLIISAKHLAPGMAKYCHSRSQVLCLWIHFFSEGYYDHTDRSQI